MSILHNIVSDKFCSWHTHNIKRNFRTTIYNNHRSVIIEFNFIRHFSHNISWRTLWHHHWLYSAFAIGTVTLFDLRYELVNLLFKVTLKLFVWLRHLAKCALRTNSRVANKKQAKHIFAQTFTLKHCARLLKRATIKKHNFKSFFTCVMKPFTK